MPTLFDPVTLGDLELPNRILWAPLNPWNAATFYGEGPEGYTDYPALAEAAE